MAVRLIDAGTVSFVRSQTLYHGLSYVQTPDTPDTIVLVTPQSRYMCIGFFQDAALELNLDYCQKNHIPVIRRETGGGTVYIVEGQLFVQWIFQKGVLPARSDHRFQLFIKPLVETYKFFGIDAYYHPVNDVHVDGKKIAGTGAGTIDDAEVVTGNFLFGFYYKQAIVEWKSKKIKLFFSRQGKNGKWKVFITTNPGLSFIQMIEIYQTRWTIEVFFKRIEAIVGTGQVSV
ncbi:MAG: lipoate--protein ligase family protein [Bacteroidetes bacterium]|nr:lipoate--protein ligase family protein [Bacteroidota bacterium]